MSAVENRTPVNAWSPGKRAPFNEEKLRQANPDIIEEDFWEISRDVWDYTCLSFQAMYNLYSSCVYVIENDIPGDFIECGVFFGGSVMLMTHAVHRYGGFDQGRRVVGLDTFCGFTRRSEDYDKSFRGDDICLVKEGAMDFYEQAHNNIRSVDCDQSLVEVVRGDVFELLAPTIADRQIALLRLDTDSYDTTKHELEVSWDRVSTGGAVIIDDYGWCIGARKATDDFIQGRKICLNRVNAWTRSFVKP